LNNDIPFINLVQNTEYAYLLQAFVNIDNINHASEIYCLKVL